MKKSDEKELYIDTEKFGKVKVRYFLLSQELPHPYVMGRRYFTSLKSRFGRISIERFAKMDFLGELDDGIFGLQPVAVGVPGACLPLFKRIVKKDREISIYKRVGKNEYKLEKTVFS